MVSRGSPDEVLADMKHGTTFLICCLLVSGLGLISALPQAGTIVSYDNHFGNPSSLDDPQSRLAYLDTWIEIVQKDQALLSASPGHLLFSQRPSRLMGGLPRVLGGMLAFGYGDGMVAVLSGLDYIPVGTGRGSFSAGSRLAELARREAGGFGFRMRLFDQEKSAWVNPLLLMPLPRDIVPPRLENLTLRKGNEGFDLPLPPKGKLGLAQGLYAVFIRAVEPKNAIYSSGVFRYRVLLDGQVVLDRKMDSAQCTGEGMAFTGLVTPSSSDIDDHGSLGLGNLDLPRGQHLLEIGIFDFSGNQTQAAWRLTVD